MQQETAKKNGFIKKAPLTSLGCGVLVLVLGITLALSGLLLAATMETPNLYSGSLISESSKVFADDGSLLTVFRAEQYRVKIPLSQIPANLRKAVIAVEDERFYQHHGIDARAIIRALIANYTHRMIVQGGSTLTQQLVKNLYITREKTLSRKLKEALLALQIEQEWSKKDILEKYLNVVYFGQGVYGVGTAAQEFFGKKPQDLSLSDCALLAALVKSPTNYSPYVFPKEAKDRRNLVLNEMAKQGYISEEEASRAMPQPVKVRQIIRPPVPAPYFVEYVKQMLIDKYGANMVFKGGLQIYTTLSPAMQKYAERAIDRVLYEKNDPAAALVALDPESGAVKAMVGGKGFGTYKFNLAVQGRRQPGSSFKPFVLITALEKGISPLKPYETTLVTIPIRNEKEPWKVKNYGDVRSPVSLRDGTIYSINTVFARLIMEVTPEAVVETARKMGITTPLEARPSIALGGLKIGVSPLEMAGAFGTLANFGYRCYPDPIIKITDSNGKIVEKSSTIKKRALDPKITLMVNDILRDVILVGTGMRANIGRPAAGKTGTNQNYRDAWFVGYTPDLVTCVWVGYPSAQIAMTDVHGISVTGGSFPARIWGDFMTEALKNTPANDFGLERRYSSGQNSIRIRICRDTWKLATPYCPNTYEIELDKKDIPKNYCTLHKPTALVTVPDITGMNLTDARIKLENVGLTIDSDLEATPYKIFSQNLKPGLKVLQGSSIKVEINFQ